MKVGAKPAGEWDCEQRLELIQPHYVETVKLLELLHHRLLEVVKDELERRDCYEINAVQALLLYNIGDKELSAGELRTRGCYLGANVSYNLKKLVEFGFVDYQRSRADGRSVRVKLTHKGAEIRDILEALFQKHVRAVENVGVAKLEELAGVTKLLRRVDRFWTDQVLYRL